MNPIAEQGHEVSTETLMGFLDGELSAGDRTAVERHVAGCRECQQMLDAQKLLRWSLDSWTVPDVPPRLEERVLAAAVGGVSQRGETRLPWLRKPWLVAVLSSAATIAVLGTIVSRTREEHPVRDTSPYVATSPTTLPTANMLAYSQSVDKAQPARREQAALSESLERSSDNQDEDMATGHGAGAGRAPEQAQPMIARTASLLVVVKQFPEARTALDTILAKHHGYAAELTVSTEQNEPRALQASLRIPASELAAALGELKALGQVQTESQSGEEVTQQHADLMARLKNSRQTEQRLANVLQQRTGKIGDVLEVEREIARVRGEIEQMEAEQQTLEHRVQFASVDLKLNEEYRAALGSPSPSVRTRLRNAVVQGLRDVGSTMLSVAVFLMQAGPSILFWLAVAILPLRFVWKRRQQWFARGA